MNGIAFLLDYYDIHGEQRIYKFLLLSIEFLSPGKKQPTTQLTYFNKEQKNVSLACVQKSLRKRRLCTKANLHIFVVKYSWSMASFTSITSRCSGK